MSRSKKGGLLGRRRSALERLEKAYEEFKKAGVDKAPHVSIRNGKPHTHKGRKYADECKRMEEQIKILKGRVNG